MKKIVPALIIIWLCQEVIAQQNQPVFVNNPFPKTISVSGSAEMEIVPDEIFVNIVLTEYQKRGETKKDLETIKAQFLESCKSAGISDSLISIIFYSGYNNSSYYFIRKRKTSDLFATITYQVKFKNTFLMDNLVDKLDDNATQSFRIVSTSHSRINEYRKQLKIKAIQTAKEKGIYLTEAMNEKLGETITVTEPVEWQPSYNNNNYYNALRDENARLYANAWETAGIAKENGNGSAMGVDFTKIKLRFEVNVVFALK